MHTLFSKTYFIFITALFALVSANLLAQKPQYFKGKYQFPIKGSVYLTGNMGEIRPNHFHGGLDVLGGTTTPIYATYDGYIGRVKASTYGYGNVIYITHPETNHITVYAHIHRFDDKVGNYVRKKQYEQETFEIDLYPQPNEIPIKKGEVLGYVGNTGASFGAHLHYEIRNGNETALNPLLFFDNVVTDKLPPIVQNIGVVPLSPDARIFNQFQEKRYALVKSGNNSYKINGIVQASGDIGFEIRTYDVANNARNTYATTLVKVKIDGKQIFQYDINNYPMDESRCMNVHINYDYYRKTSQSYQRLYETDGNFLNIYQSINKGRLFAKAGQLYDVLIEASDVHGNTSTISLKVQGVAPPKAQFQPSYSPSLPRIDYQIEDNTLLLTASGIVKNGDFMTVYFQGIPTKVPLAYMKGRQAVYIWDLRNGFPDAVGIDLLQKRLPDYQMIPSHKAHHYRKGNLDVFFADNALFDTTAMLINYDRYSIQIGDANTPLARNFEVSYNYKKAGLSFDNREKWGVFYQGRGYQPTTWTDSTLHFSPRYLGSFTIAKDITPPAIRLLGKSSSRVSFAISDGQSGIKNFKAKLNGKFILMQHESKASTIWTDPDWTSPLKGDFELYVWDELGNMATYKTTL